MEDQQAPSGGIGALEQRLRRLEDREAIFDAVHRYHHTLGALRREDWLDCFAADGLFVSRRADGYEIFRMQGHDALAAWYDKRLPDWPAGSEGHALVNPRILGQDADQAEVASFFITFDSKAAPLALRSYGDYHDRLRRSADGRWRIVEKCADTRLSNTAGSRPVAPVA